MKRFLSIAFCLMMGWAGIHAQYRVYSYAGGAQYKKAGPSGSWKAVKEDVQLESSDTLRIPAEAFVRVEYVPQNKLYKISGEKQEAVYILVRDARNNLAARILKGLNKALTFGRVDTMKHSIHSMEVLGAGSRGEGDIAYDELAEQLAWIGAQACSGTKGPKLEGLELQRFKLSGGELDFEMVNRTNQDYHMNVLHVNKRTHSMSLCYVITSEIAANSCPITPSGFCSCALDVYFPDTADDIYILIALKEPYDSDALDNELLYHRTDKAKKTKTDILYTW